jgi:hypothetical protein
MRDATGPQVALLTQWGSDLVAGAAILPLALCPVVLASFDIAPYLP